MADVQVTISVEPEVQALCDQLAKAATDVKAKAPTATLLADGAPILLTLLQSWSALAADLKSAEALAYLGLTVGKIVAAFAATAP